LLTVVAAEQSSPGIRNTGQVTRPSGYISEL